MTDKSPNALPTAWLRMNHKQPPQMTQYLYAAYGSNLLLDQMGKRCPQADIVGAGRLRGARLIFSRVASIVQDENNDVLLGVYSLNARDIDALDRYEGLGRSYDRVLITPEMDGMAVRCFTYIKRTNHPEPPSDKYFAKIVKGFKDWRFPDRRLYRALERCKREALRDGFGRKQQASFYDRWEPMKGAPTKTSPSIVTTTIDHVEWGLRKSDKKLCFRFVANPEQWYLDISTKMDERSGLVRGLKLASNPPIAEVPASEVVDQHAKHGMNDDGDTFTNSLGQIFHKKNGVWVRDRSQEN